jgi:hypothetical protein
MIRRCYDPKNRVYSRYGGNGVHVCDEWLNFQNFAPWYKVNYVCGFKLDKDLRIVGNKKYSPHSCEFIPVEVNNLFISSNACRGMWPVGVSFSHGRFKSECWGGDKKKYQLGYFKNQYEAFEAYKSFKRQVVDDVATKHYNLGNISEQIYTNLLNWEIVPYPE